MALGLFRLRHAPVRIGKAPPYQAQQQTAGQVGFS